MRKVIDLLSSNKTELENMVESYRDMSRALKAIESDMKALKASIIDKMGFDTEIKNRYGNVIATYKEFEREDFDKRAFAESYPDIYPIYLKKSAYKMFVLK